MGEALKPAKKVLLDLVESSNVSVRSSDELVGKVEKVIAADDKVREENGDELLRRKPRLAAIPRTEISRQMEVTLWDVLHTLGRATALSGRGAGRGLAEHSVTILPADTVLRAGWALTSKEKGQKVKYRYRPQYFAEVWRPGEPSLVMPIACKGNHGNAATSAGQLASASVHAEAVHIGGWNETPSLLFSTELPTDGTVTVHTLQAPGRGAWLAGASGESEANLGSGPAQENVIPGIQPPPKGDLIPAPVPGCQVTPKYYTWFQETLGHTAVAGLMAFTGSGKATAVT
ncbi:hypothetical protein [Streptomyces sp. NBC_01244]|uniref:hypothetical protein n=1 Tax=Streptomyces sp. NBC_01244 TaxID=2903797 RepID=UPI002E152568